MVYQYDYKYKQSKSKGAAAASEEKQSQESGGCICSRGVPYGRRDTRKEPGQAVCIGDLL
ncbi:hypothetical protein GCM10008922_46150 [Faecalicatena contorta]